MTTPIPDPEVEAFLAVSAARLATRTVDAYRRDLTSVATALGKPVGAAGTEDIERYLAGLRAKGLASTTIARRAAAIRSFFRHQTLLGARADNPAAQLDLPRRTRRLPRTLSPGEAERLVEAARGTTPRALRDHALVELLYGAGLRVSEAVGLERGGVDLDDRFVRTIGKGGKERVVPMGSYAVKAVEDYLVRARPALAAEGRTGARGGVLFLNARGGALSRQSAWSILRTAAERAGLTEEASPHTLRHSFATHLLDGGADVRVVQELLGHASVTTTQVYTLVTVDKLREVWATSHPRALI
jgi:integrase/recombinase XerD